MNLNHVGVIGHGEVGKTFSAGLKAKPGVVSVGAWDLKFVNPASQADELAHAARLGVTAHAGMHALQRAR